MHSSNLIPPIVIIFGGLLIKRALITLQNKAVRITAHAHWRASCDPTCIYKNLNIMKLAHINTFLIGLFMFCMSIGMVPDSLTSIFKKNSDFHSYITRIANLYHVLPVKLDLSKTGIWYRGATIWNRIALEEINSEVSETVFKKNLIRLWQVRHFVSMHMTTYMCNNCRAHQPWWVYRCFCYTNLCFKVNAILFSCCTLHYLYMWNVILVFRMAINLIWFDSKETV